jgi:superfamily II DNA or RNA helicase
MDARTPDWERQRIIANFADGRLPVLCNCMLATEGFDLSAQVGREVPIEAVVMLRPTKSLALATQMCGRALRRKDRPAIILDHVGNTDDDKHGLPDQEVEWDLAGKPKRATKKTFACKICYGVFSEHFNVCPSCGAIVGRIEQGKGRPAPEQIDGELVEVDAVERARKRRQYDPQRKYARTLEELKEYGKAKGYKDSWAQHVWDARQNKGRAA